MDGSMTVELDEISGIAFAALDRGKQLKGLPDDGSRTLWKHRDLAADRALS